MQVLAETDELIGAEQYVLQSVRDYSTARRFVNLVGRSDGVVLGARLRVHESLNHIRRSRCAPLRRTRTREQQA